ncbi:MAG: AAA family ATPase [Flavonifractor plautii]
MKHVVITIGREYGSGGRLIAKQLSEELGITFYDKELITAVARKTGFSENFIRDSEHQRPTNSFLYDLYTAVQTPSVPDQVFIAQAKVIKEAASRESCVIVGRCADYILRDDPRRLSVFVHAPLDERVRRAREEYGVQEPNLESFVLRQDKARASYYNYFATGKSGQSREYDLCVSSHMGIAAAVATIKAAALAVAGGTGA